jgi:hypothetical protein
MSRRNRDLFCQRLDGRLRLCIVTDQDEPRVLREQDFPDVLTCADRSSARAQHRFLFATASSLTLMALAAIMGAVDRPWSAWVGAGSFLAAIGIGALAITQNLERTWYDGRALAESAKSLAWLYAARGGALSSRDMEADKIFASRLGELRDELRKLAYVLPSGGQEISPAMRMIRASLPQDRRQSYERGRLADQIDYYRSRGEAHNRQANYLRITTWAAETLGFVGALLRASNVIHIDLLGVGAACAAGLTAWLQTRDHVTSARAYELTAEDLDRVRRACPDETDESAWSAYVAGAEAAMSREHVMWIARRGRARLE